MANRDPRHKKNRPHSRALSITEFVVIVRKANEILTDGHPLWYNMNTEVRPKWSEMINTITIQHGEDGRVTGKVFARTTPPIKRPVPKKAKPLSLLDLTKMIPDEEAAVRYLEELRWPEGNIRCPHCGSKRAGRSETAKRQSHRCRACSRFFSVRTGTPMANSPLPLQKWILAMYLILSSRTGIASTRVAEQVGCTQKTAWHLMHRIREAMKQEDGEWLSGVVEVDETFVGGSEKYKHKIKRIPKEVPFQGKLPVMGLRERGTGRVAAFPAPLMDNIYLRQKVRELVEPGSTVYTDGSSAYFSLWRYGYEHESVNHSAGEYVRGDVTTNRIENFWSIFKLLWGGVYFGTSWDHLHRYLNEFTYRYNEPSRGLDLMETTILKMEGKRLPYKDLVILGRLRRRGLIDKETLRVPTEEEIAERLGEGDK